MITRVAIYTVEIIDSRQRVQRSLAIVSSIRNNTVVQTGERGGGVAPHMVRCTNTELAYFVKVQAVLMSFQHVDIKRP